MFAFVLAAGLAYLQAIGGGRLRGSSHSSFFFAFVLAAGLPYVKDGLLLDEAGWSLTLKGGSGNSSRFVFVLETGLLYLYAIGG